MAQLEHDRFLKQKERDLALKKGVFLDAAAAVQQAISVLGMTNDVFLENADISKIYREKLSAIAKLQVIASMDTIKALGMFSTHAAGSFVDLMAKRAKALQTAMHVRALDTVIAGQQGQVDSMLERMKQFNLSGKQDPREWSHQLQRSDPLWTPGSLPCRRLKTSRHVRRTPNSRSEGALL